MTAPVLYHHFGSKAGLYRAVVDATVDAVLEAVEPAATAATDLPGRVAASLDALLAVHREHPRALGLLAQVEHDVRHHAELADLTDAAARLPACWDRLVAEAGGDAATAAAVRAVVDGFVQAARSSPADDLATLCAALGDLVRHGLERGARARG